MPLQFLKRLLGQDEDAEFVAPAALVPAPPPRPRVPQRQVYEGRPATVPDFARDLEEAHLVQACDDHQVCSCSPHFERHRLYRTFGKPDRDGNMPIEYEGVTVSCSAISDHGLAHCSLYLSNVCLRYRNG